MQIETINWLGIYLGIWIWDAHDAETCCRGAVMMTFNDFMSLLQSEVKEARVSFCSGENLTGD